VVHDVHSGTTIRCCLWIAQIAAHKFDAWTIEFGIDPARNGPHAIASG
jgi:hypothetical protein